MPLPSVCFAVKLCSVTKIGTNVNKKIPEQLGMKSILSWPLWILFEHVDSRHKETTEQLYYKNFKAKHSLISIFRHMKEHVPFSDSGLMCFQRLCSVPHNSFSLATGSSRGSVNVHVMEACSPCGCPHHSLPSMGHKPTLARVFQGLQSLRGIPVLV